MKSEESTKHLPRCRMDKEQCCLLNDSNGALSIRKPTESAPWTRRITNDCARLAKDNQVQKHVLSLETHLHQIDDKQNTDEKSRYGVAVTGRRRRGWKPTETDEGLQRDTNALLFDVSRQLSRVCVMEEGIDNHDEHSQPTKRQRLLSVPEFCHAISDGERSSYSEEDIWSSPPSTPPPGDLFEYCPDCQVHSMRGSVSAMGEKRLRPHRDSAFFSYCC